MYLNPEGRKESCLYEKIDKFYGFFPSENCRKRIFYVRLFQFFDHKKLKKFSEFLRSLS